MKEEKDNQIIPPNKSKPELLGLPKLGLKRKGAIFCGFPATEEAIDNLRDQLQNQKPNPGHKEVDS